MSKRFNDDQIRRTDLPRDVFLILHDPCYDVPSRDRRQYKRRAQAALRVDSPFVIPPHFRWLTETLIRAYQSRPLVLSIIGDIAKLIVKRRKWKKISNTTCIACGGWIPKEREDRRQHTCSDACQNWYRILTRAIDAEKVCRYCGHGLPRPHKSIRKRRPARPRLLTGKPKNDAAKSLGAPRQGYVNQSPVSIPAGTKIPLVPNARDGVDSDAVRDALEAS